MNVNYNQIERYSKDVVNMSVKVAENRSLYSCIDETFDVIFNRQLELTEFDLSNLLNNEEYDEVKYRNYKKGRNGMYTPPNRSGLYNGERLVDEKTGVNFLWDKSRNAWYTGGGGRLEEVVITANTPSGVAKDSLQRYAPVWGSSLDAYDAFHRGDWGWGITHSLLAVSDVFLIKSVFTGIGKAILRQGLRQGTKKYFGIGMSHSYGATVSRLKKLGVYKNKGKYIDQSEFLTKMMERYPKLFPKGEYKHHWLISQELMKRYPRLLPLGNQTWNLTKFRSQAAHMRWAHGQVYKGLGYNPMLTKILYPITSTPVWFKTSVIYNAKVIHNYLDD